MLKDSKVTFKNGTLNSATGADCLPNGGILIQNYCDLTLENVTLDTSANSNISYVISNNFGSLTAKGNTVIKAADGKVAFDLWYGMNSNGLYDDGVSVTFGTDFTGSVTGKIEYGAHSRVTSKDWMNKAKLTIANGNFDTTFVDSNPREGIKSTDFNISISGGTFSNLSCVKYMTADSKVTVDLNGKTVNGGADFYAGDLTIKNGTVEGTVWVNASTTDAKYNHLTVAADATIGKGDYAVVLYQAMVGANNFGSTIDVYGKLNGILWVMGNIKTDLKTAQNPCVINVHDGAEIEDKTDATNVGIALNGAAILNVDKAMIAGSTGIEVRAGQMTLNGATVTGKAASTVVKPNDNGVTTDGAGIAVAQHTTKLPIEVTINSGAISGYTAFYESNPQNNAAEDLAKINIAVKGGEFKAINGGTNTVYSKDKNGFITGGYFTSDPTAYLAEGKYVIKSDKAGYTYAVTDTKPEKTPIFVDENTTHDTSAITDETTKSAIDAVINKAKVEGVAAAVDESALVASKVDASEVDAAKKVDVEVTVKVNVTSADMTSENKTLTFEASPVATITVTKANGTTETKDNVKVSNSMLNGQPITVKLPLPADFNPEQIKHISSDGSVEYFLKTAKRGANTFEIKDGCAVFTITKFSTFELSGTVTYVEPSYYSGSSSAPTYSVTVDKTENGSVTVSPKSASKGSTVTITVKPDSGYTLETLTAIDSKGKKIQLTDKGEGKYTFTMPADKVEVKATFMDDNTMLNFFVDVKSGDYYYDAVLWAAKNGITSGTDAVHFSPEQPCTRAQIVTFLWRAAGSPEPKGAASGMSDVVSGSYYEKAVAWAIENGITTGTGDGEFSPDDTCTRAQAVTFLARALNAKAAGKAEFSDVPADSYFADAVAWAAANGVTEGIGGGLFGSDNDCTRGQIVTFLYRAYNK